MRIQNKPMGDEVALFVLDGELDAYTGPQLREELTQAADSGKKWLLLDMSAVQYIDSVGLGILVGATKRLTEKHGDVAVIAPRPNVLRVFEVSGTRELLNVVESLEEARCRLKFEVAEATDEEGR
ncbi:MAG: STAS domain-containing protein [Armatimonadota bacterium]